MMKSVKILPLGDSNTRGKYWDPSGYRNDLWALFQQKDLPVEFIGISQKVSINVPYSDVYRGGKAAIGKRLTKFQFIGTKKATSHAGFGGAHIVGKPENQLINIFNRGQYDSLGPDYVLLMVGTNDLNSGDSSEKVLNELEDLIRLIRRKSNKTKILVSTITPYAGKNRKIEAEFKSFNKNLKRKIDSLGIANVISVDHRLNGKKYNQDDIHPTQAGYEKIAKSWFNALEPLLNPKTVAPKKEVPPQKAAPPKEPAPPKGPAPPKEPALEKKGVRLVGSRGFDQLRGELGDDLLLGRAGNDTLLGGGGDDKLQGAGGKDLLIGGKGKDTLVGGSGNDRLRGQLGQDLLKGGAGKDILRGGRGRDKFTFGSGRRFRMQDFGRDIIRDYQQGQDRILLSKNSFTALSAMGRFLKDIQLDTVLTDGSAGRSSAPIAYSLSSGKLFYNPNGTRAGFGSGGQFARLSNIPQLSATDFILI